MQGQLFANYRKNVWNPRRKQRIERMRKWKLPLTYVPKIEPVSKGECTQTIRTLKVSKSKKAPGAFIRKEVGDLIRFYVWQGRPYWSKPIPITEYMHLTETWDIVIKKDSIIFYNFDGYIQDQQEWKELDWLAIRDGIVPATGEALRDVLMGKNKIPFSGVEAQILRWNP
jgi:hypothetical protein